MSAPLSLESRTDPVWSDATETDAAAGAPHELPDFIHQLVRDFIVYADQKGAFVFLAATTLVGYLAGAGATDAFGLAWSDWRLQDWLGGAAFVLSTTTALLGASVFAPGHRPRKSGTILDWRELPHDQGETAYVAQIEGLTQAEARAEVLRHSYVLGMLCRSKHRVLDRAFRVGFLALASTIAFGAFR